MRPPISPATYIDHDRDFRQLIDRLTHEPLVAVDTESNSMYVYRERVCLVQLSTRTADYIIDPLRVADLSLLAVLFENPAIEKVFHAAEYDLLCLRRDYGLTVTTLFDTMVAARICGHRAVGLDRLLNIYLGIEAGKSHQRDNWGERPLPDEALRYAQRDTYYLPALRDKLYAELNERGMWVEALESFAEYADVPLVDHAFDPEGYWRIAIPRSMKRRDVAILRELYLLRDELARERDVPPYRIMGDNVLVALSEHPPAALTDLKRVKGLGPTGISRYGAAILKAVARGQKTTPPRPPPRPSRYSASAADRFTRLRDWRRERADQRGVESDVIITKEALWAIAERNPQSLSELEGIKGLGAWRLATYGADILARLRETDAE
ncbi:MAG: HRDC domain-containing protein [Anaerolineae bacterium]|nr:HRDC domain-containing protein [Anaerolineae bacterium]